MQVLCLFGPNQFPVLLSRAASVITKKWIVFCSIVLDHQPPPYYHWLLSCSNINWFHSYCHPPAPAHNKHNKNYWCLVCRLNKPFLCLTAMKRYLKSFQTQWFIFISLMGCGGEWEWYSVAWVSGTCLYIFPLFYFVFQEELAPLIWVKSLDSLTLFGGLFLPIRDIQM